MFNMTDSKIDKLLTQSWKQEKIFTLQQEGITICCNFTACRWTWSRVKLCKYLFQFSMAS